MFRQRPGAQGSARVLSARRATWAGDGTAVVQAQRQLDAQYNDLTYRLDAGQHCRNSGRGASPRRALWHVLFDSQD